ncbi:MAG: tetratricopeptide repeat protein [Bacteroidota bacterium]|nr:tetratricopeptide repeat protein [Bacteroidota bacterium]
MRSIRTNISGLNILLLILACITGLESFAQEEKKILREGNRKYKNGKYVDAEKNYLQSINEKQGYLKAEYNLGNTYYKQGKYSEAADQFENVVKSTNNQDTLSKTFHNLGNAYLKKKNYERAVSAYKSSLKINSKDDSTRYNLAYALKKMQEQQKQGGGKGNDQKQNKDDKEKSDKEKQEMAKKNDENQKPDPQQGQMSKEEAQRMLDALKNNEKKIAVKKKHKGDKSDRTKPEKDW